MRGVLAIVLVALVAAPAAAQDGGAGPVYVDPKDLVDAPEVTAAASPSEVRVGDRFVLIVEAVYGDGVTVNLPARLDLGPAFEERRRTSTDKRSSDGRKVREWQIEVLAWELGEQQVPPVQVTVVAAGAASVIATNAVPVRVVGALGDLIDGVEPRGLAPPLPLWRRTWLWVGIAAGVVALALAVAIYLRRRRRPSPITLYAPVTRTSSLFRRPRLGPSADEALARLEAVDSSGMLARDRKAAYAEMIDILQTFLGRHLGGDTSDLTTGELRAWIAELPAAKLAPVRRPELERWLDACELVKFGGYPATVDEGRDQIAAGRDLVIAIALPGADAIAPPPAAPAAEEAPRA